MFNTCLPSTVGWANLSFGWVGNSFSLVSNSKTILAAAKFLVVSHWKKHPPNPSMDAMIGTSSLTVTYTRFTLGDRKKASKDGEFWSAFAFLKGSRVHAGWGLLLPHRHSGWQRNCRIQEFESHHTEESEGLGFAWVERMEWIWCGFSFQQAWMFTLRLQSFQG